jgi:hypothetical protein
MLLRAIDHLNEYERTKALKCSLLEENNVGNDHIGNWKAAGKEYGFGECDDEEAEMNDCPLCGAQYAAYKAKKILKNRVGRINGILTRMGKHLRSKQEEKIKW